VWYVYIVRCAKGALYTGITDNLVARLKKHNSGTGAKAIRALGVPVSLVYSEQCNTKSEALKREYGIKRLSRNEKEKLIAL
jgi:putative endonuclease